MKIRTVLTAFEHHPFTYIQTDPSETGGDAPTQSYAVAQPAITSCRIDSVPMGLILSFIKNLSDTFVIPPVNPM